MIDLKSFVAWQEEKPGRSICYEKKDAFSGDEIWVYDYHLAVGQYVKTIDEIDLIGKARAVLEEKIKKLEALNAES